MVVQWRPSPEWLDRRDEFVRQKGRADFLPSRVVQRCIHVPADHLGESLAEIREPETPVTIARAIADNEHAARNDAPGKSFQQPRLFVRREIMEQIEEDDVAGLVERITHVSIE